MLNRRPNQGTIAAQEIISAYTKAFKIPWWKMLLPGIFGVSFQLADQTYNPVDWGKLSEILEIDRTENQEYVAEAYDCDDFAYRLMGAFHRDRETAGMAIFITWVKTPRGGHALLSFYYQGDVVMIESQTDEIFDVPKDWQLSLLCG